MAHGRWYPTATTLGDGRVMTFSGSNETGGTNKAVEIYTVGSGMERGIHRLLDPAALSSHAPLAQRKGFLLRRQHHVEDLRSDGPYLDDCGNTIYGNNRTYGSSVLLPLTPANNYDPQVIIMGGGSPATKTTETIDLGAATPVWKQGPPMSQERIEMNAVILPNGKVLAVGGSLNDEQASSASLNADLYNPSDNTFTTMAPNVYPRLYHSNALLLPDATVWLHRGQPEPRHLRAAHGNLQASVPVQRERHSGHAANHHQRSRRDRMGRSLYGFDPGCGQYLFCGAGAPRRTHACV